MAETHQQQLAPFSPRGGGDGGAAGNGQDAAVGHERQKSLDKLFNTLVTKQVQVPMRDRKLPPSFFTPSPASNRMAPAPANSVSGGHHSRDGSGDSSYSSQSSTMQSPARVHHGHFKSASEPVVNNRIEEPLPHGWTVEVTAAGQPFFVDHLNKETSWNDPRKSKGYVPAVQQQPRQGAGAGAAQNPFFQPQGAGHGGAAGTSGSYGVDGLSMEMSTAWMQQQQLAQQQAAVGGGNTDGFRQRSMSWIDQRGTAGARNPYAQRQMQLQARSRVMLAQQHLQQQQLQQQQLQQQHLQQQQLQQHLSFNMNTQQVDQDLAAAAAAGGFMPGQVAPPVQASQRDMLQRDPFMPVTGSISPDMALHLSTPSPPINSGLVHMRDGSTDSGFGLGGMDTGLNVAGLDVGNQYDPLMGNATGLMPTLNNHSMSPIPSVGSPRPPSAASGPFTPHTTGQMSDAACIADLDPGFLAMDVGDLSAVLGEGADLLHGLPQLDDPAIRQTLM